MSMIASNEGSVDYKAAVTAAANVMAWWHQRGFPQVKAWAEPRNVSRKGFEGTWGVASNLVGGLPAGVQPRDVVRATQRRTTEFRARMDSLRGSAGICKPPVARA